MQTSISSNPEDSSGFTQRRRSNWTTVRLLNVYRSGLAAVFFSQSFFEKSPLLNIVDATLYAWSSFALLILSLIWILAASIERRSFNLQVSLQIYSDIFLIILLMHACGGVGSGLGMLLIISIASTGLLTTQSHAMLFASLAAIGLLTEHVYSVINIPGYDLISTQAGVLGAALLATAYVTHLLSMRVARSEQLAQKSARDLALLSALNQDIIENLQAGVIVLNSQNRIQHINQAASRLLHLSAINRSFSLYKECPKLITALGNWQESGKPETAYLPSETGLDDVQLSFRELQNMGQTNVLVFVSDVSSIKNSMQQAKLASLGHLTANIAHEIRNPLGAISYAAQLLEENEEVTDIDRRMIEIINQHTQRINHIIEDILNTSRDKATLPEHINLQQWLPAFIHKFCQSGEANESWFTLTVDSNTTDILFDEGHLDRIMTNLCHNALAYGNRDKPLIISVFDDDNDNICIEIADQGPGIDPALLDQIFEPFYTTGRQGSGLGLYIVSQLCELNNARISASNNEYNGTSFTVTVSGSIANLDN